MKNRLVTYAFLSLLGIFFCLCSSLYGKTEPIDTLKPEVHVLDLKHKITPSVKENLNDYQLELVFYSTYSDSAKFVIFPGNWDKITTTFTPENGIPYQVMSGHFVPKKAKSPSSWIFYRRCMLQRMGLQNQIEFTLAPKEKIQVSLHAEQYTDLPLFQKLEVRELNAEPETHGLFRFVFQFLFLGIVMILFVYHFTIFIGYKEPLYLYYALYMVCMIIHTLDYNGLNSEVFLANNLPLRPFFKTFADNGIIVFYLLLLRRIIRPIQYGKIYDTWIKGLIIFQMVNFAVGVGVLLFSDNIMWVMTMGFLLSAPAMILVICIAFPVYRSRDRAGRFFITGSIFLLLGNVINVIMYISGLEGPVIFGYFDRIQTFQFSSLIELLWFSFAIAQRIRRIDIERERIKTVDQIKTKLFTFVFQQSRNPLTLILGPTRSMLNKLRKSSKLESENLLYYLESIDRNALRLLEGTDQLLDLAKVDEGKMKVYAKKIHLSNFLSAQIDSAQKMAILKEITFEVDNPFEELEIFTDPSKLKQILDNLLKRAFWKIKAKGKIKLLVNKSEGFLHVHIWSSDDGISQKNQDRIFERFYNFDQEKPEFRNVFGVRMALSRELAKILRGNLYVKSEKGLYTNLTLELPLGAGHLEEYELLDDHLDTGETINIVWEQPVEEKLSPAHTSQGELPLILVIEEDPEIRNFISVVLQHDFHVLTAEDGEKGFELAKDPEHVPDLIISEVVLPKLNGFDLARQLKIKEHTQHIPIILLSSQIDDKFQLDGYKLGIDTFLLKPFDPALLKERVKNLINQRILLRKKYLQEFLTNGQVLAEGIDREESALPVLPQIDQDFVQKVKQSLIKNSHKDSYTVESLAEDCHYQRRQLNRKVKDLLGTTPAFLIRKHRMDKACDLLEKTSVRLADIAETVGYKTSTSFSKAFKEHMKESPTSYRKRLQNGTH